MDALEPFAEIPVMTRLSFGTELLRLVFVESGIIVAHLGKRGWGSMVGSSFLGRLSGAVEDLFKTGRESRKRKIIRERDHAGILAADKDNFKIDYVDVVSVDIDGRNPAITLITILTKDAKYEFFSRAKYETLTELFEKPLRAKVTGTRS